LNQTPAYRGSTQTRDIEMIQTLNLIPAFLVIIIVLVELLVEEQLAFGRVPA